MLNKILSREIEFVLLGRKFSGGKLVLDALADQLHDAGIQNRFVSPICLNIPFSKFLLVFSSFFLPVRYVFLRNKSVVLTHSLILANPLWVLIPRSRKLFYFQGEEWRALPEIIGQWILPFVRFGLKHVNTITTNQYLESIVEGLGGQLIRVNCSLGPLDVFFDSEKFRERRQIHNKSNLPKGIVFARAGRNKGLGFALNLALQLKHKCELEFVSNDLKIGDFLTQAGVNWIHPKSRKDIAITLSNADFLILPSRYEGLSLPLLEALACSLKVFTCTNGFPEYFSRTSKYVCFVPAPGLLEREVTDFVMSPGFSAKVRMPFIERSEFSQEIHIESSTGLMRSFFNF